MKGMFLKKFDIYYQKCATVAQRFQLSMTKLGACDEIRWNDGMLRKVSQGTINWAKLCFELAVFSGRHSLTWFF
jgi:hypothetical protein